MVAVLGAAARSPHHASEIDYANSTDLKERLKDTLNRERNKDVTSYYHTTGFCQKIARAQWFENLVLSVIAFNALWIWIDVDYNQASSLFSAHPVFILVELFLCFFFSYEWAMRFGAFRRKCDCWKDGWFIFDSILVSMMVVETTLFAVLAEAGVMDFGDSLGKASILRLLRLLRLTRLGKLMSYIPEVMILLAGMLKGLRSVSLTMFVLAVLIYVVAIAMVQLAEDTDVGKQYFGTVPEAMYTLLIHGMVPDHSDVMEDMKKDWVIAVIFVWFVFFSTFTILNMLIGILCEVVSSVKQVEKERMDIQWLSSTLKKVMEEQIDSDHDGLVSKAEFLSLFDKSVALDALAQMGFDVISLVDYGDILFGIDETEIKLSFDDFIAVLLQSRRSQAATQKDIRELQKFLTDLIDPRGRRKTRGSLGMGTASTLTASQMTKEPMSPTSPTMVPETSPLVMNLLEDLQERVAGLETLMTTALDSQPQLLQRMSTLEADIHSVSETQKQLLDRLPSADLLQRLSESVAVPHQPVFSARPGTFRPPRPIQRMAEREVPTCTSGMLFCEGPTPRPPPANAMRNSPLSYS